MQTNFQQVQGRNLITKTKKTNRNWQRYLTNQGWSNICGADRVETDDVAVVLLISYRSGLDLGPSWCPWEGWRSLTG